jgi:hypothetical protein
VTYDRRRAVRRIVALQCGTSPSGKNGSFYLRTSLLYTNAALAGHTPSVKGHEKPVSLASNVRYMRAMEARTAEWSAIPARLLKSINKEPS